MNRNRGEHLYSVFFPLIHLNEIQTTTFKIYQILLKFVKFNLSLSQKLVRKQ